MWLNERLKKLLETYNYKIYVTGVLYEIKIFMELDITKSHTN